MTGARLVRVTESSSASAVRVTRDVRFPRTSVDD